MTAKPFNLTAFIPYEADIQKAILCLLAYHPNVAWSARFNSGAAWLKGAGGRLRPVSFNTLEGCPDIMGMLKDGRHLAIEIKRPPWSKPTDDREHRQAEHIDKVNRNGGVGFFATSTQETLDKLNSACTTQMV